MNAYEFRKRKLIRGLKRIDKVTPLKCTLYVQMKPLWKLMRAMGLLPYVEVPETGNIVFHWLSTAMFYSVIIFTLLFILIILTLKEKLSAEEKTFDFIMYNFLNVITLIPSLFIPLTFWNCARNFVNYIRFWAEFERNFVRVTRINLDVKIKKCCIISLTILVFYGTTAAFLTPLSRGENFSWFQTLPFVHIIITSYLDMPYTGFLCHILINTCKALQKSLAKDGLSIKNGGDKIREHRHLYVQLVKLTRNMLSTFFGAVLDAGFKFIASTTFCLYICLDNSIDEGFDGQTFNLLIIATVIFCVIYYLGIRFQMAYDSVQKNFIKYFFKNRRDLRFYEENAADEIKIFTKIFRNINGEITCNGYFSMNQSTVVSIMSLITTYLLIILQFKKNSHSNP